MQYNDTYVKFTNMQNNSKMRMAIIKFRLVISCWKQKERCNKERVLRGNIFLF